MNYENQREDEAFDRRNTKNLKRIEQLESKIDDLERELAKLTEKTRRICDKLEVSYDWL